VSSVLLPPIELASLFIFFFVTSSMDAKLGFDDNAVEFRQPDIAKLRDPSQEDPDEVEAGTKGLNFIKLDGDIGCLVNGAGLAMATMDVVKLNGGNPANFLDIGGGADAEAMKLAFKLLLSAKPKALFVNVFGGIVSAGKVAESLIEAAKSISKDVNIDIVARLRGNEEGDAKRVIESFDSSSGVRVCVCEIGIRCMSSTKIEHSFSTAFYRSIPASTWMKPLSW
jgi:succinyl-CoA synthetase beta subunit